MGSGTALHEAYKKYGKKKFQKEILEFFNTKEEAFLAQEKWINEYNTLSPNGYNISPKGGLHIRGCHSKETIEKIRKNNIGKNNGKTHSQKSKMAISEGLTGRPASKKSKEFMRTVGKLNKGKKRSVEFKENLRKYVLEHKEENTYWKGKKFSNDHKEKLRLAAKKRWSK
jgi:hypothetical protein